MGVTQQFDAATEAGFLACYRATFREIYGYAGLLAGHDRAMAEDLVHEVYLHTLRRARSGEMATVTYGYLRVAVRHHWIDRWRNAERERARSARKGGPRAAGGERAPEATDLLADLPERERTVMVLRYVDDLAVPAIAERLGVDDSTVDGLLDSARTRLRRAHEGHDHA